MTYQHEFDRQRLHENREYSSHNYDNPGAGKWLLMALLVILAALGAAMFLSGAEVNNTAQSENVAPTTTLQSE